MKIFKNIAPHPVIVVSILLLVVATIGCSPDCTKTNTVFIRDTTYKVLPPVLRGFGAPFLVTDTVVKFLEMNKSKSDTLVFFEYLPSKNVVQYVNKPDTVFIKVRDTLNTVRTEYKVIEYPFWSKVGLAVMFLCLGILAGYIIKSRLKNESEDNN